MKPNRTEDLLELSLKSAIALLLMASASLIDAQTLQTLHLFAGTHGANPYAALTLGNDGNFYGTTYYGGIANPTYPAGMGTVFKMTTNGTLTTLVSLRGTNGAHPTASLTLGSGGNFYGTTEEGGSSDQGTVFQVTTNGTLVTLVSCGSGNRYPVGGLTLGSDGNFYGTTIYGGSNNMGTIFQVTTNGTLTTLVSFADTNGANPYAALTLGNDGNFYGTTRTGGTNGGPGTVFKVTTSGALTTLVSFQGTNGTLPYAALTLGDDGDFYGTTGEGGSSGNGTMFKVTTNGTLTTLVSFNNTNGSLPFATLTKGNDGNFYGTTYYGGTSNSKYPQGMGTIFQVTTNGTLATLFSFADTNGANPYAALTLANDGNFYGTTFLGGATNSQYASGMGTVYRLAQTPAITVQPQSQTSNAGATVTFLVSTKSLLPIAYQWQKDGTNLANGGNLSGATSNTLTITGISDSDAGSYSVIVSNSYSSVTSSMATLTVIDPPVITSQPTNLLVLQGTNVAFGFSLTGTAPFRYQWRFNGTNLLNATNASYTIASIATNKAGNYSVVVTNVAGVATSSNAVLTVVVSPNSRTNYAGSTVALTATAFSPEPLSFQWQKNGTNLADGGNLSGTASNTLTIANVSDADAAVYQTIVSDASASVTTSNAVLTVNNLPFIASQPQNQTGVAGRSVTFSVTVYGAPPFIFQWYFKGVPVGSPSTGTNFSSYTVTNATANQAGNYSVRVVNGYGSVTSSNAWLTVVDPPKLALHFMAGYPLLDLYGLLGRDFVVQYNTNLAESNWLNLLALTNLSASPYQFLDPAGSSQPARFYRAFMQ